MLYELFFLVTALTSTLYMSRRINQVHTIPHAPLIDVLHTKELVFTHKYYKVSDYLIDTFVAGVVLCFNEFISTYFLLLGIMYYVRIFTFSLTILPKPGLMANKDPTTS